MTDQFRGDWTSASNALADRLCRGRHQAQQHLPELPRSHESDAGSAIHALWTGTKPIRETTVDEMEKAQALREQENSVAGSFFKTSSGLVRIVEGRLWHTFPAATNGQNQANLKTSGQFDVTLVHPESRRALICDGKSGRLPVPPNPANLQLRRLAALLWLHLEYQEIGVCILQPFAKGAPPCVYMTSDLQRSVGEMEDDVRQSHQPNAKRTAGADQCRYCRAREGCPTRLNWLSAALPVKGPRLPLVSAREWTPAQRALFLEREKDAHDWLETRKEEIKALLAETPEAVPGYGLKPGRTLETITDTQEVLKRFCDGLGGTMETFLKCIKLGKMALKQEVRALSGRRGQALEAQMDALLAGCIESKPSAPSIERLK
jgi:Protein of unknown function (DUF2800)